VEKLVISFDGSTHKISCIGCTDKDSLGIKGLRSVYSDSEFGVYQDFETSIPGFYVLETKRYVKSILQFNRGERLKYAPLVFKVRSAMAEALGITEVTFIQEERSGHFHLWLFPHYDWMERIQKPRVENIRSLMDYAIDFRETTSFAQDNMRITQVFDDIEKANEAMRILLNNRSNKT
jgi:diadenosine tetraphosphate (Ap4A) HIT family hydrolase